MRIKVIDVLKAIGIISIVIGHSTWAINLGRYSFDIGRFVYLYHIAIFIFSAGFTFKRDAVKDFSHFLWTKIKTLYIPFVKCTTGLLILRPLCVKMGIIADKKSIPDYISIFINVLLFQSFGELASSLWFVPMFFAVTLIFGIMVYFSDKSKFSEKLLFIFSILLGSIGMWLVIKNMGYLFRLEIALMEIPIVWTGYFCGKNWDKVQRYIHLIPGMGAGILIYCISNIMGTYIDVSCNMVMGRIVFYFVSILGIYFALSIANFICKFDKISNLVSQIGKYTFIIMAFHLIVSKFIDWFYIHLTNSNYDMLLAFPRGFKSLTLLYWIVNTLLPIGIYFSIIKIKDKLVRLKFVKK